MRSNAVPAIGFIVLLVFVAGCGPDIKTKTVVTFDRAKTPTLGKVAIVSVYEPHGPTPGVINLLARQTCGGTIPRGQPREGLEDRIRATDLWLDRAYG